MEEDGLGGFGELLFDGLGEVLLADVAAQVDEVRQADSRQLFFEHVFQQEGDHSGLQEHLPVGDCIGELEDDVESPFLHFRLLIS